MNAHHAYIDLLSYFEEKGATLTYNDQPEEIEEVQETKQTM